MKSVFRSWVASSVLILTAAVALAQSPPLKIVKLAPPSYPPIARAANVWGEVHLQITLQEDGKLGDIQVKSGPEMLKKSAEESAKNSLFEFTQRRTDNSYELIYKFNFDPSEFGEERDSSYPHLASDSNIITIAEKPFLICDYAADRRVRSVKCLYLWRCAWRLP